MVRTARIRRGGLGHAILSAPEAERRESGEKGSAGGGLANCWG